MQLEELRVHLSHTVLEDLFRRLVGPGTCWPDENSPIADSVRVLAGDWRRALERPGTVKEARDAWYEADGVGVRVLVRRLYKTSCAGAYRPTSEFPSWDTVSGWLNDMEGFLMATVDADYRFEDSQLVLAERFWRAFLGLYGFVQGLKYGSQGFRRYFELSL